MKTTKSILTAVTPCGCNSSCRKNNTPGRLLVLMLTMIACLGRTIPLNAQGIQYVVTDLGTLGGASSFAFAINNAGQVTGAAYDSNGNNKAFLYSNGVMSGLSIPGASTSLGVGINSSGQVAGIANPFSGHAFLYSGGTTTDLGTLGGGASLGDAVNDSGQVTGWAYLPGGAYHAYIYSAGSMSDLGTFGGTYSYGFGINNSGQVTGYANVYGSAYHGFLYSGGNMIDMGTLGGVNSQGSSINNSGQVAGYSNTTGDSIWHATLYSGGTLNDLGTLGGANSWAYGINKSGQVTGQSSITGDTTNHAFLYSGGTMYDLNDLVIGLAAAGFSSLDGARSINDNGWIVGWGTTLGGQTHAFIAKVAALPLAVFTDSASGVSSYSADFNGHLAAGASVTNPRFEWGTSTAYGNTNPAVANQSSQSGLLRDTTYHYRFVAEVGGVTQYGDDACFVTGHNAAPVAVDDKVVFTSGSAVVINVTANDTDADGDTRTVTSVSRPSIGTARITGGGTTVTYTPLGSFLTHAWSDSFTYTISDGNGGTATAKVTLYNPFYLQKGNFAGLTTNNGFVTLALTGNGAFTGKVRMGGGAYALSGVFDASGHYTHSFARVGGGTPVVVSLSLDVSQVTGNQGYYTLTGTVDGAAMNAYHVLYNAVTNPAPQAGSYTVLLPGNPSYPASPQGTGYATLTVTEGGSVTMTGVLADGTAFTDGTYLTGGASYYTGVAQFPVWAMVKAGNTFTGATITGAMTFEDVTNVSDCDGTLNWNKPAQAPTAPAFYRSGFNTNLTAIASRYLAPPAGVMALDLVGTTPNATVQLSLGGMASAITKSVTVGLGGNATSNSVTVTAPAADNLAMSIDATHGTFSGSFTSTYANPTAANPAASTTAKRYFFGALFHKQNIAGGYFISPTASGKVSFTPQ